MKRDPLFTLVQSFFEAHLSKVRGASAHTIAAYRDTMKLFLQFAEGLFELEEVDGALHKGRTLGGCPGACQRMKLSYSL